jgi:hypothetical protein
MRHPRRRARAEGSIAHASTIKRLGIRRAVGLTDQSERLADSITGPRVIPWGEPANPWGEPARLAVIPWGEPAKLLVKNNYSSNSLVG